ncbi:phage baseplate assembly protein V [Methylobacillus arboreus]|uniref:phage baseplate assembly protein V n=1 Tax=Methylobacillus arboreus TaxID=755170 RepID=UPI001E3DFE67|nr:phage baseplate assembly protein V [Methylobacillus arboreus]MCB5191717.1 phage baseplate assembly protein V [Methylobacillus arboreus]
MTIPSLVINGTRSSLAGNIKTLRIEQRLNALPNAYLQLEFDTLNAFDQASGNLLPGQLLGIQANDQALFQGKIQQQKVRFEAGAYLLTLICQHEAVTLQTHTRSRYFAENSDLQTIQELLAPHEIEAEITPSTLHHNGLVQHNVSDWDFLLQRLDANGLVAYFSGKKLIVTSPTLQPGQGFSLPYKAIINLDIAVDASQQVGGLSLVAWNSSDQALFEVKAEVPDFSVNDRLATAPRAEDAARNTCTQRLAGEFTEEELQIAANARLTQLRLASVQGKISALGLHHATPGQTLKLDATGIHLSGNYYISGVTYEWPAGAPPQTSFELGLPQQTAGRPTSNTFSNLLIGKVIDGGNDPTGEGRIKVTCPLIDPQGQGTWTRLATLQAGMNSGTVFRPAIGSEVILGLISEDPNDIVILGACHSSAIFPPWEDTDQHGFQSPGQLKLTFDDNRQQVQISTRNGTNLLLSQDTAETFLLEDQHQNKIRFTKDGLHLQSARIFLESDSLKIKGLNIDLEAEHALRLKGGTVEINSSATLTLKGSMVHIN